MQGFFTNQAIFRVLLPLIFVTAGCGGGDGKSFANAAKLANHVADMMLAGSRGDDIPKAMENLAFEGTPAFPETVQDISALGDDVRVVMTVFELEAVSYIKGEALRTNCAVLPSGRIGFAKDMTVRDNTRVSADVSTASPILESAAQELIGRLQEGGDSLPMASALDREGIPEQFHDFFADGSHERDSVAREIREIGADAQWEARLDDFSVLVRGTNGWALLKSQLTPTQDKLLLDTINVQAKGS